MRVSSVKSSCGVFFWVDSLVAFLIWMVQFLKKNRGRVSPTYEIEVNQLSRLKKMVFLVGLSRVEKITIPFFPLLCIIRAYQGRTLILSHYFYILSICKGIWANVIFAQIIQSSVPFPKLIREMSLFCNLIF